MTTNPNPNPNANPFTDEVDAQAYRETLADFVNTHFNELKKRRWESGLMADSEVLEAIEVVYFSELDQFEIYQDDDDAVHDFCVDALGIDPDVWPLKVKHSERELSSCTDEQFQNLETIKKIISESEPLKNAEIHLLEKFGCLADHSNESDPELRTAVIEVRLNLHSKTLSRCYCL